MPNLRSYFWKNRKKYKIKSLYDNSLKKKKEILDQERHNFIYGIQAKDEEGNLLYEEDGTTPIMEVKGCINNGIDEETASQIYEDILPFANYGLTVGI